MALLTTVEDVEHLIDIALKDAPSDLPGPLQFELVCHLDRVATKLCALQQQAVAAFDASGEWEVAGHKSANDAMKQQCRRPGAETRRQVQLGRKLRTMPVTETAFANGDINDNHVGVLARVNKPHLPFAEAESMLVEFAQNLSFADFDRAVKYWEQVVAPRDADDEAENRMQRRELHLSRLLDGMGKIDGWLDPIGYAEFQAELKRLERLLFEQDWEEGKRLHGPEVSLDQLSRTSAQRRADALVLMANRSAGADAPSAPRPLVNVHIDHKTFDAELRRRAGLPHEFPVERTCELDDGTVITPAEAVEQALMGHVRRVVWESPGVLLDVGRRQRLFVGALRDALVVRDRVCTFPSCEIPAENCEADHIHEWQDGGSTNHRNGEMLCSYHHRRKRRSSYPPPS